MCFNPNPFHQAQEVSFSANTTKIYHPPLAFNYTYASQEKSQNSKNNLHE